MLACDVRWACASNYAALPSPKPLHNSVCSLIRFRAYICTVGCRVKYEQTIGDVKRAVEKKLRVPMDKQQLFWQNKELTKAREGSTLLELGLHTGASLKGYDLVRSILNAVLSPPLESYPAC